MPDQRDDSSASDPINPRVTRLEEHAAFSEHTIEQLSVEIAELNRRCRLLTDRLASLEQRLGKLVEEGAGGED